MRVLFVTEQFPFPLDTGGNVRTFHLLRALAAEHDVTLLAVGRDGLSEAHVAAVREFCRDIHMVPAVQGSVWRELGALWKSLQIQVPFILERHRVSALQHAVATLVAQQPRFDAVHFNHLDAALYIDSVPANVARLVDQHNVVSNQVKTTVRAETRVLRRTILRLDYPRLQRFEAALCNRMDACFVCSDTDAEALAALGVRARTVVIPNGVDLHYFEACAAPATASGELVFVGTLDYDPCEKGVWYFCKEILPLIRAEAPAVRFVAVGRNPSARLLELARADAGIVFTGRVEDIRPHVHRASVFVVPLLSGSGTRLKILEAMAMGVPVVSTTIGAEGIVGADGEHFRIGDTPAAFARAVIDVLRQRELELRLRAQGRRLVEERYSWKGVCDILLAEYRQLAARPKASRVSANS